MLHSVADTLVIAVRSSVSKIESTGGAVCNFFGIDGSTTFIVGSSVADVGPPQQLIEGICDNL